MEELSGRTAVITGAASGIGRAFAQRFAEAGMNIVLADIEEPALDQAVTAIQALGVDAIGVVTDVSDGDSMDALAAAAFARFDQVNVVCNNAGVGGSSLGIGPGELDAKDWKWVIDVNLWGVIHGHRVFLPHLMEHGDGHIVNTASMAGHMPGHSAYMASKWAVVGITEGLFHQLAEQGSTLGVSCLCPGWVQTNIADSSRNRPEWAAPEALTEPTAEAEFAQAFLRDVLASGAEPSHVAQLVHDAVIDQNFWVFTDGEMVSGLKSRFDAILENRNPVRTPLL